MKPPFFPLQHLGLSALCVVALLICSSIPNAISYAISTHDVAPIWLMLFHPNFAWILIVPGLWIAVGAPAVFVASGKQPRLRPYRVYMLIVWPLSWGLLASFVGANGGWDERRAGLIAASARAQPLINAIEQYRADKGALPAELGDLVPQYLSAIPNTGMTAYPKFYYRNHEKRIEGALFHSYEFGIHTNYGLSFDRFYYWPENNYPPSSSIERIGNWAYLHE